MKKSTILLSMLTVLLFAPAGQAADAVGYTDTPMLPGNKWHVHDPARPQPRVVTPGTFSTQAQAGKVPSDAIALIAPNDLSKWKNNKGEVPKWKMVDDYAIVSGGDITTRDEFTNFQLHVEFATPKPPKGDSQARGNSGVFLIGLYEFQVLDSYQNRTYADGGAASMYGQYPPLVNASLPPGEWQVYDIVFTAPHFKDGKLETPAYVTAFHNGVLVQNHRAYLGPTNHRVLATETPHAEKGPIRIQDHGNPTRYRNMWIRPLLKSDESE
jgi:hypothetical protein